MLAVAVTVAVAVAVGVEVPRVPVAVAVAVDVTVAVAVTVAVLVEVEVGVTLLLAVAVGVAVRVAVAVPVAVAVEVAVAVAVAVAVGVAVCVEVAVGVATARSPIPLSLTFCGLFAAPSVNVRDRLNFPVDVGLNATDTTQEFPALTALVHPLELKLNAPLTAIIGAARAPGPLFLNVTLSEGLVMPAANFPKFNFLGVGCATGSLLFAWSAPSA